MRQISALGSGRRELGDTDGDDPRDGTRATSDEGGVEGQHLLRSESLFCGRRQVVILHNNEQYVLRLTRQGKLILNK